MLRCGVSWARSLYISAGSGVMLDTCSVPCDCFYDFSSPVFPFAAAYFLLAREEASTFFVSSLFSSPFSWPLYLGPQASALPQGLQGTSHLASLLTSDDLQMTESTQVLLALLCWLLPDSVNLT